MTRFLISLEDGVKTVFFAINNQVGGEIYIPKMPSCKIVDLCKVINSARKIQIVGLRPGEKMHEELIQNHDSPDTIDIGKYYIILANNRLINKKRIKHYFKKKFKIKNMNEEFSYNSKINKFLNLKKLKTII